MQGEEYPPPPRPVTTWRACCLAPMIAVAVILLLTVVAGLFSPQPRRSDAPRENGYPSRSSLERRESFITFGKRYFAIARKADACNERAFQELEALRSGAGSLQRIGNAFHAAGEANRVAAAEYKALSVPRNLLAPRKLEEALDGMSNAYDARRRACEAVARWTREPDNRALAREYIRRVDAVNQLTIAGLAALGAAAQENGLTMEDVGRFLPPDREERTTRFGGLALPIQ